MSQYDIVRSCGHTETIQIYGPNTRGQRERRAARETRTPCRACRRINHGLVSANAAVLADLQGWPALTGSAEQIAWAQTVRADAAVELHDWERAVDDQIRDQPHRTAEAARTMSLMTFGTFYVRAEPCESCGAPLALQEYTMQCGDLDDTVLRWMEIIDRNGQGVFGWIIRDHGPVRCRAVRLAPTDLTG